MKKILKFIFYISILLLIVISIWPGSLFGYLFYNDWRAQPHLIDNPFGTTVNHFIYYTYVSLLGFFLYFKNVNFKKIVSSLFFLSIILELLHLVVPNRSFEAGDLIGNILGVTVAYFVLKIYLLINKI